MEGPRRYTILPLEKACPLEQRRDLAITITTILAGQTYDGLCERHQSDCHTSVIVTCGIFVVFLENALLPLLARW